jgi:hypothetical protein
MKKFSLPIFFLILLNFCFSLSAETKLEVRADAFFHASKLFRKIYGDVGASYGVEASTTLGCWENFEGWVNFDWYCEHGRSHVPHHNKSEKCRGSPTRIRIPNFSFGVKYVYQTCGCFAPYIGVGPSFSRVRLKNKSFCTHEEVSKYAYGVLGKVGVYYYFNRCTFVDVFVDYLYQPVHFHKQIDVGGLKTGLGVGVIF